MELINNDAISKETIKLYNEFGRDFVKILVRELKRAGKNSTGSLINSIDYRLKGIAEKISVEILGNDYLTYVDEGRKRGSYPPINELKRWASLKGIPQSAAFGIATNIYKFGIKPTNVIDKTYNEFLTSSKLTKKYEDIFADIIEKNIFN